MEIQNVTEKHLLTLRKQVETDFELEMQEWHSKITDPEELSHIEQLMQVKHSKKMRETDMKLIALLDQKVMCGVNRNITIYLFISIYCCRCEISRARYIKLASLAFMSLIIQRKSKYKCFCWISLFD